MILSKGLHIALAHALGLIQNDNQPATIMINPRLYDEGMLQRDHPADLLDSWIARRGAPVCVGMDPVFQRLPAAFQNLDPASAFEMWGRTFLDAIEPHVPAVKFQSACFERHGVAGMAALAKLLAHARGKFLVILDGKRGDIGISTQHYAAAVVEHFPADWVTANAYLGADGFLPFLQAGLGVFALVRTSNASGDLLQSARLHDGRTVSQSVADVVAAAGGEFVGACGFSALGAVVGATKSVDAKQLRQRMPRAPFLVPGFGAQGGGIADALQCFIHGRGALITASRSVMQAFENRDGEWSQHVAAAAKVFAAEISTGLHAQGTSATSPS
ncbi:MAG: orotidine-5'-phosphate decarboxylase [Phycisphaerales bacterium]|nr:orotidine-5'-phosphate decarboxylase [Phycisphaerales bacterium]